VGATLAALAFMLLLPQFDSTHGRQAPKGRTKTDFIMIFLASRRAISYTFALALMTLCASNACAIEAESHRQVKELLDVGFLRLENTPTLTLMRIGEDSEAKRVVLFIEGDGAAWRDHGFKPPDDPTPKNSLSLRLALNSKHQSNLTLIYVARPCQFKSQEALAKCSPTQWSTERYNDTQTSIVETSITLALKNVLATVGHISDLQIIGHSGGGVLGVKIAVSRLRKNQIFSKLYAISSPIDPETWLKNHRLNYLPIGTYYQDLALLGEIELLDVYLGENDRIVRPIDIKTELVWLRKKSILVPKAKHISGWIDYWDNTLLPKIKARNFPTE
jgi:hypothetical protein